MKLNKMREKYSNGDYYLFSSLFNSRSLYITLKFLRFLKFMKLNLINPKP